MDHINLQSINNHIAFYFIGEMLDWIARTNKFSKKRRENRDAEYDYGHSLKTMGEWNDARRG